MIKTSELLFRKKLLSFFTITGSCGGLYIVSIVHLFSKSYILTAILSFCVLALGGIIIGTSAVMKYRSPKNILIKLDKNGDLILIKQKIFLLVIFPILSAFIIYNKIPLGYRFLISFFSGVIFVLGLAGGIYEQFNNTTKKSLILGLIPLSIGFVFVIFGTPFDKIIIWSSGMLYLLSALLTLNSIQLFAKILNTKDINIKNTREIRRFNFKFVSIFFIGFMIVIFFRNILASIKNLFSGITERIYLILSKFTNWLYRNSYEDIPMPPDALEEMENPSMNLIAFYILMAIIILASTFVIVLLLIFLINTLKNIKGKAPNRISYNTEYIDEFEIIKTKEKLFIKKKLKYTKSGLSELIDNKGKIRYLYGFILERLYHKKIKIKLSDTPQEILETILNYSNGQKMDQIGFQNLTEIYRQVRYGNKDVEINGDIIEIASKYEKTISEIKTE